MPDFSDERLALADKSDPELLQMLARMFALPNKRTRRPVLVLPLPGASTGTGVSSACSLLADMT